MPLADFDGIDEVQNGVEVQEHGPAILSPAAILQNLVEKSNEFISEHRNWLARFPQGDDEGSITALSTVTPPTSTNPAHALITPPPSLELRAPQPQFLNCISQLCDCTPQVTAATASLGSILSASIIRLQSNFANASSLAAANSMSLDAAKLQLAGFLGGTQAAASSAAAIASSAALVQASANAAVSAAQTSASLQISAVQSAAQISVGSAVAAASAAQLIASSANSLVLIAQSSASSAAVAAAVASASAQQILASANAIAASANSIASDAKATATLAQAQAQATISSVTIATTNALTMSASKFAAIIIFSVLGTALVSILSYYLILRYRKARKLAQELLYAEQNPEEFYEKTIRSRSRSRSSRSRASSSDYGRRSGSRARSEYYEKRNSEEVEVPEVPLALRQKEEVRASRQKTRASAASTVSVTETSRSTSPKRTLTRTNTLVYDPNEPDKPPRFRSWLTDTVRSVSPFGDFRDSKEIKAQKKREDEAEIRKVALRKAREGEERREQERRKRESDERRLRIREGNEEVERKVSQRRGKVVGGEDDVDAKEMNLAMGAENKQKSMLAEGKKKEAIVEDYEDSDDEAESIIGNNVVSVIGTAK